MYKDDEDRIEMVVGSESDFHEDTDPLFQESTSISTATTSSTSFVLEPTRSWLSSNNFYSSCVSALYIPAAFGLWSWPVLLNLLLGSGASASSILFSHYVAFNLTLILGGISMYLLIKDHPRGVGPVFLTLFALPLVMFNPTINLMQDKGTITSTKEMNILLNIVTWIGVLEMTFASGWNSSIDRKVAKRCSR